MNDLNQIFDEAERQHEARELERRQFISDFRCKGKSIKTSGDSSLKNYMEIVDKELARYMQEN